MQLVKNVFLESRKTVARKAQEALITWVIESNRLVPKERLLEVYLNIIEWGPGVYGITEASHFYFAKSPDALTLAESIFLASLVPHPRYYRYSVDAAGCMRPFLIPFFKVVSGYMLRREQISQDEYDRLVPDIELTGPARDLVRNRPGPIPDSVETMIREDLEAPME